MKFPLFNEMKFKTWKCFKDDNNTERTISRKINFFRLDSLLCWYPYKAQQHSGTGWWFQYIYLIRISLLSWNLQSLKSWFPLTTHLFFIQIKIQNSSPFSFHLLGSSSLFSHFFFYLKIDYWENFQCSYYPQHRVVTLIINLC